MKNENTTLPVDKGRCTVILYHEEYLGRFMDHINNGLYVSYLKKDPTTTIKAKTLKILKENEFIDNKLYYYPKPTDSLALRFYGQSKICKQAMS